MARRCICSTWVTRAVSDAGFRVLPLAIQGIWLQLLGSLIAPGAAGRIRFLGSVTEGVSRLVSIAEPEAKAALESFAELGFLELDEDGRTAWLPGARDAEAGVLAARENGRRGGRPRKGETREQMHARREREATEARAQRHLPLPIAGGVSAAETQETQAEPDRGSSRAGGANSKPDSASASPAMDWREMRALCDELEAMAGIQGPPHPANFHTLRQMLNEGATAELLRQVVGEKTGREGWTTPRAGLGYFIPVVREALRGNPEKGPARLALGEAAQRDGLSAYGLRLHAWRENGCVGPMPVPEAA